MRRHWFRERLFKQPNQILTHQLSFANNLHLLLLPIIVCLIGLYSFLLDWLIIKRDPLFTNKIHFICVLITINYFGYFMHLNTMCNSFLPPFFCIFFRVWDCFFCNNFVLSFTILFKVFHCFCVLHTYIQSFKCCFYLSIT